ncbi:MAG: glycoside hydrolase family 16 protein [Fimbriimonadaceae bacterium]|nr:glycoside hydrolase family 16 protein [Fimbriimonadaceae bacterium]
MLAACMMLAAQGAQIPAPMPGYQLAWHDEFDGWRIDQTKWKPWALGPRRDAVNVPEAARLDGRGQCYITTRRVTGPDGKSLIQSGGIWTRGTFAPRYGYFEARIQFQTQLGHWGAFWLNCDGMGNPPDDPNSGTEVDIVEFHQRMAGGGEVQHNLHWNGYGDRHKSTGAKVGDLRPAEEFHTYGVLWEPKGFRFFVDGRQTWVPKSDARVVVSSRPEYLILSLEVGSWAGNIQDATLPDWMIVDWVRVWRKP